MYMHLASLVIDDCPTNIKSGKGCQGTLHFLHKLMNGPYKLDFYITLGRKGLPGQTL
jgi:hypothetical protein